MDSFYPLIRYQALTFPELLAAVGGLMGLFVVTSNKFKLHTIKTHIFQAGVSVLSIIELFYYFGLRQIVAQIKKKKSKIVPVQPRIPITSNFMQLPDTHPMIQLINYSSEYCKATTVHGFSYIVEAKRHLVEK